MHGNMETRNTETQYGFLTTATRPRNGRETTPSFGCHRRPTGWGVDRSTHLSQSHTVSQLLRCKKERLGGQYTQGYMSQRVECFYPCRSKLWFGVKRDERSGGAVYSAPGAAPTNEMDLGDSVHPPATRVDCVQEDAAASEPKCQVAGLPRRRGLDGLDGLR